MAEWDKSASGCATWGGHTRLAGSIEAEHEQSHFLVAEQAA